MRFISLSPKRSQRQHKLAKLSGDESPSPQTVARHEIHTYVELRKQIHDDLRSQHPEWIKPDGQSPMCDAYEARLMELLGALPQGG